MHRVNGWVWLILILVLGKCLASQDVLENMVPFIIVPLSHYEGTMLFLFECSFLISKREENDRGYIVLVN